jgi:hypothetical protein
MTMIVLGDEPVALVGGTRWYLAPRVDELALEDPDRVAVARAARVVLEWKARGGQPLLFHLARSAGRPEDGPTP